MRNLIEAILEQKLGDFGRSLKNLKDYHGSFSEATKLIIKTDNVEILKIFENSKKETKSEIYKIEQAIKKQSTNILKYLIDKAVENKRYSDIIKACERAKYFGFADYFEFLFDIVLESYNNFSKSDRDTFESPNACNDIKIVDIILDKINSGKFKDYKGYINGFANNISMKIYYEDLENFEESEDLKDFENIFLKLVPYIDFNIDLIYRAIEYKSYNLIKIILDYIPNNVCDSQGFTPLHLVFKPHIVLDKEDYFSSENPDGYYDEDYIDTDFDLECFELIFKKFGITEDNLGRTPFYYAQENGFGEEFLEFF